MVTFVKIKKIVLTLISVVKIVISFVNFAKNATLYATILFLIFAKNYLFHLMYAMGAMKEKNAEKKNISIKD